MTIRAGTLCAAMIAGAAIAAAQTAPDQPAQLAPAAPTDVAPAPAAPAPAAPSTPVLPERLPTPQETFSAIGRFIDQSISNVNAGVKGAGETLGSATTAAGDLAKGVGDAAGTMARLPTNVVTGMERCPVTPAGAPNCLAASVALCKQKGFADGKSVDITSAQKCPAEVLLRGRVSGEGCRTESFVSKAVCQ